MVPFGVVSQVFVRSLKFQITVVVSLAPRQIDRGDVGWPYTLRQKQGSTEAGPVEEEEYNSSFSYSQYSTLNGYKSSIFKMRGAFHFFAHSQEVID